MSREYRGGSPPVSACGHSERLSPFGARNREDWMNVVHIQICYSLYLEGTRMAHVKVLVPMMMLVRDNRTLRGGA